MKNAVIKALICLSLSWIATAQQRIIPHVTRLNNGFEAQVVIANLGSLEQNYELTAWNRLGAFYDTYKGTLEQGATLFMSIEELFAKRTDLPEDAQDVSHITINADERVTVTIVYKASGLEKGPAHVKESNTQTLRWRIYAGDPSITWDGLAVVNTGEVATPLSIFVFNAAGEQLGFISPFYPVEVMEKEIYLLTDVFEGSREPVAWYEILGAEPLSVIGLRGRRDNAFLWENEALPMEPPTREE